MGNARGRTRSAKLGLRHKVAQGHGSVTRHFSKWCPPIEKVRTCPKRVQVLHLILSHRIHIWCISVWYIFLYIYHKNQANVSKYTGRLDPMGINPESTNCVLFLHESLRDSVQWYSQGVCFPQQHCTLTESRQPLGQIPTVTWEASLQLWDNLFNRSDDDVSCFSLDFSNTRGVFRCC